MVVLVNRISNATVYLRDFSDKEVIATTQFLLE